MRRQIIEIDASRCDGCGACIPNCPEGALQIIDGKARLVGDLFCDGLGACVGECPRGAIRTVEREAEPYDERKVMENIAKQGANTIAAHLGHLKNHGEMKLLSEALDFLRERNIPVPAAVHAGGCPGSLARKLRPVAAGTPGGGASALRQWPIQLRLLNPEAECFDDADLLVSADCVAHAHGAFHRDLLAGKILIIFCPKLDQDPAAYVEKLARIFRRHRIRSVTAARMAVPCCGGTELVVKKALEQAEAEIPLKTVIVGLDGTV